MGRERLQTWCAGRRKLGTCNITQFAQNPLAGISAVAAFSCTCILSETANQPKLDISGQNGYFCKFLGSACPTSRRPACVTPPIGTSISAFGSRLAASSTFR